MTSPDLPAYTDLVLFDAGPLELFQLATDATQQKFPGASLLPGDLATVILEAQAIVGAEVVYAANRLPARLLEGLLGLLGVARSPGVPATGQVLFRLADTAGRVIPAGTRVALDLGGETGSLDLVVGVATAAAPGAATVTADIAADGGGSAANGTPAGTAVVVRSPLTFVDGAELASSLTGGADPESDEAYLSRAAAFLAGLVTTLVVPRHFVLAALRRPEVGRAFGINNHDPARPGEVLGGYITVAALGHAGALLSGAYKLALQAEFGDQAQANLAVRVVDPDITNVPVNVTVHPQPDAEPAQVQADVALALEQYLSPATWPWSGTVRRNELIALVDGVAGVDYVVALTSPGTDVALPGVAPLARLTPNPTVQLA